MEDKEKASIVGRTAMRINMDKPINKVDPVKLRIADQKALAEFDKARIEAKVAQAKVEKQLNRATKEKARVRDEVDKKLEEVAKRSS